VHTISEQAAKGGKTYSTRRPPASTAFPVTSAIREIPFQTQPIHLMKADNELENYIATTKIGF